MLLCLTYASGVWLTLSNGVTDAGAEAFQGIQCSRGKEGGVVLSSKGLVGTAVVCMETT